MVDNMVREIYDMLSVSLPAIEAKLESVNKEVETVKNVAESNYDSLRGRGNETGLVHKVDILSKEHAQLRSLVNEHDRLLYHGKDETEPGLVSQVRLLRAWQKGLQYWYLLFIGAIIVGLINIGLQLLSLGGG